MVSAQLLRGQHKGPSSCTRDILMSLVDSNGRDILKDLQLWPPSVASSSG